MMALLAGEAPALSTWDAWADGSAWLLAPALLGAEVANALLRGVGLPPAEVASLVRLVLDEALETVEAGPDTLVEAVILADRHGLTVYDGLYLATAVDLEAELATLDAALARAAAAEGVPLVVAG